MAIATVRWSLIALCLCVGYSTVLVGADQDEDIPHNEVKNWALKFGVDLWEFGRHFTKMNQIQTKYHDWTIQVVRKDGLMLIRELVQEVENLMEFKMSAVMRIMDSAEQAALSSGASTAGTASFPRPAFVDARRVNVHSQDGRLAPGARRLVLTPSRHFDHIAVNTSCSAVLVPPFLNEDDPEVQSQIQWSEHLDPLFVNNYEGDPGLSWQYYASSTGFLRRYPAISWPPEDGLSHHARSVYDFRSSSWFVGAGTSPRDLLVLLQDSPALGVARRDLARATVAALLDTLGPDDFVNVYRYGDVAKEIHPCFTDTLAQATTENIRQLKEALWSPIEENGNPNMTAALVTAFDILQRYNRTGKGCQCNQALAVVGSGEGAEGSKGVFRAWNWPHMPVRLFTYRIGGNNAHAHELRDMACSNKGFYASIHEHKEIHEKILNHIAVLARPMVMYQADHPVHWSPVYVGGKGSSLTDDNTGQLMTSVTMPIFDRRNHSQRAANLLGVVGTDVPIDQIKKLVLSYKLGVNGYSFIVDNNGHVLYHPDLRPLHTNEEYTETLRPLYTNIDLTEVELADDDAGPRENNTLLLDLRHEMIEQKEGETELGVRVHYEGMRRVSMRRQRYFYTPIRNTPFSLGIALPDGYGMYELEAEQEIKHSAINVTEYFKGNNWRIHPDWVYCEYNSGAEQTFRTPEEQLLHFLGRSGRPGWKWMSLRPRSPSARNHKQEKDSYFCDKKLVQSLVRDAMVVQALESHSAHTNHNRQGYQMFMVTLSFVATRSGLLQWTEHVPNAGDPTEPHFSDKYRRAFDADWYRRAVEHHSIEPESFVFSVPFRGEGEGEGTGPRLALATHAVFVEHRGHRAPAAVVGMYFQLDTLAKHFVNVTSACTLSCKKTCASDDLDCYILDDNGFIILSEDMSHTGRFFGQIDGTIMDSLVQDRIYKKVPVYDYQGRCADGRNHFSGSGTLMKPMRPFQWVGGWLAELATFWFPLWDTVRAYAQDDDINYDYEVDNEGDGDGEVVAGDGGSYRIVIQPPVVAPAPTDAPPAAAPVPPAAPRAPPAAARSRPCDRRTDLYHLQADRLNMSQPLKGKLTNCHSSGCERPFSVQKITKSNLILLVVDTLCPCGAKRLNMGAVELPPPRPPHCRAASPPHRRRATKCINYHPEEIEIQLCGRSPLASRASWVVVTSILFWFLLAT